jgi:hypothetical protein
VRASRSPASNPDRSLGTRLPDGWALPPEWRAWAVEKRPDLDVEAVGETFADHWHAQPGAKGRKADWFATWRNWVRNERPPVGRSAVGGETPRQRAARERTAAMTGGLLASKSPRPAAGMPAMPQPTRLHASSRRPDETEVIDV